MLRESESLPQDRLDSNQRYAKECFLGYARIPLSGRAVKDCAGTVDLDIRFQVVNRRERAGEAVKALMNSFHEPGVDTPGHPLIIGVHLNDIDVAALCSDVNSPDLTWLKVAHPLAWPALLKLQLTLLAGQHRMAAAVQMIKQTRRRIRRLESAMERLDLSADEKARADVLITKYKALLKALEGWEVIVYDIGS
jgi:hypothetical protein